MVNEKRWHKGEYSGNVRLNPKTFEEKELDDPYTKKLWLEDLPSDPDFLDDMKDMVKNRMENFTPYMDLNDVKVHFAGESHLDMAYKWRIEQTHKKAVKTLKKAVQHCEYFPDQNDFKFLFSSPQILEWIEEHDPILLRKIKKWVKKDKIEPVGGSWVETDCMLPSGESFVRSRFYGMKKFRDLFGKDFMPQYEWFPDSFGYNVGLPQILAKSGAMGMKTQKMTWCKQNIFPFIHFWWKSPDGSKILAVCNKDGWGIFDEYDKYGKYRYCLKEGSKQEWDYEDSIEEDLEKALDKEMPLKALAAFVGKGDGGHGPTHQEVAEMRGMILGAKNMKIGGEFKWAGLHAFFECIQTYSNRLATWKDELYLETHRGTFTTHPEVKRHNRRLENLILATEKLATFKSLLDEKYEFPYEILERAWKKLLLIQFHDILPGSCIPEVLDDIPYIWDELNSMLEGIQSEIFGGRYESGMDPNHDTLKMRRDFGDPLVLLQNTLSFSRDEPIFLPITSINAEISLDDEGKPPYIELYPLEKDQDMVLRKEGGLRKEDGSGKDDDVKIIGQPVAAEPGDILDNRSAGWWINPHGSISADGNILYSIKILSDNFDQSKVQTHLRVDSEGDETIQISNSLTSLKINKKTGALVELLSDGLNIDGNLIKGDQNLLTKGFEEPAHTERYPAWDLKRKYWKHPVTLNNCQDVEVEVIDQGPVFVSLRVSRIVGKAESQITRIHRLFKNDPMLHILWAVNWKQPDVLLKIGIDTTTDAEYTVAEQMYCDLKRKTHPETLRDKARYEKLMHKFVDMSTPEEKWGLTFINEGKYAYDTLHGDDLNVTLHKSAIYPNPTSASWVQIERELRRNLDNSEVPKNVGLRPISCRFGILPHRGGIYSDPNLKQRADSYNCPVLVFKMGKDLDSSLLFRNEELKFESSPNISVNIFKYGEWKRDGSLIVRCAEKMGCRGDGETSAYLKLPKLLKDKITNVKGVDLLERENEKEISWDPSENKIEFSVSPFEICSFKLIMN